METGNAELHDDHPALFAGGVDAAEAQRAIAAASSEVQDRAFLHDDPAAYLAGVRDAAAAMSAHLTDGNGAEQAQK